MLRTKLTMTAAILFALPISVAGWRMLPDEGLPVVQDGPKVDANDPVKRGDYLVNTIARCGDCHTPRTKTGDLDMSKHLQGAPAWFTAKIRPKGDVAERATDITMSGRAGLWSEAKMVKFLSSGGKADFPMPSYTLTLEDARAVTAYLRSLPGRKKEGKK